MSDLVERLRKWSTPIPGVDESMTGDMMLMADAADEIDRMRAALRIFACACTVSERCAVPDNCRNFQARRALEASNG